MAGGGHAAGVAGAAGAAGAAATGGAAAAAQASGGGFGRVLPWLAGSAIVLYLLSQLSNCGGTVETPALPSASTPSTPTSATALPAASTTAPSGTAGQSGTANAPAMTGTPAMTVIWISILGILPFTLALPHVGFAASGVLTVLIGLILASAFPAIVVFAQELVPGRVGMVAGIFFGLSFGMGGIAAAFLGVFADWYGIRTVYIICSFLPVIGILTVLLPKRKEFVQGV